MAQSRQRWKADMYSLSVFYVYSVCSVFWLSKVFVYIEWTPVFTLEHCCLNPFPVLRGLSHIMRQRPLLTIAAKSARCFLSQVSLREIRRGLIRDMDPDSAPAAHIFWQHSWSVLGRGQWSQLLILDLIMEVKVSLLDWVYIAILSIIFVYVSLDTTEVT